MFEELIEKIEKLEFKKERKLKDFKKKENVIVENIVSDSLIDEFDCIFDKIADRLYNLNEDNIISIYIDNQAPVCHACITYIKGEE